MLRSRKQQVTPAAPAPNHNEWLVELLLWPTLSLAISLGPIILIIADGDWFGLLGFGVFIGYSCSAGCVAVGIARLISSRLRRGLLSLLAWPIWIGVLRVTIIPVLAFMDRLFGIDRNEHDMLSNEMFADAMVAYAVIFAIIGLCCHLVYKLHLHLERRR